MIDPALDGVVWAVGFLFLALMGARAWAVETSKSRLGRTTVRVRVLTAATVVTLAGLVGLLAVQGGAQFVEAVVKAKTGGGANVVQQQPGPAPAPIAPDGT